MESKIPFSNDLPAFGQQSFGFVMVPLPGLSSRYPSSVVSHDGLRRAAEPPEVVNGAWEAVDC